MPQQQILEDVEKAASLILINRGRYDKGFVLIIDRIRMYAQVLVSTGAIGRADNQILRDFL